MGLRRFTVVAAAALFQFGVAHTIAQIAPDQSAAQGSQVATEHLEFDAASIRPESMGLPGEYRGIEGGPERNNPAYIRYVRQPLYMILKDAFNLPPFQIPRADREYQNHIHDGGKDATYDQQGAVPGHAAKFSCPKISSGGSS
jgi:hypothetical protein